jgi:hypothetical protein
MIRIAFFLLLTLGSTAASACGCAKPSTVSDPQVQANADLIFAGEVVSVSTRSTALAVYQTVVFRVTELIRGPRGLTFTVEVGGSTSCDLEPANFRVGERYLMSAFANVTSSPNNQAPRKYYTNYCCLRERLSSEVPAA